MATAYLNCTVCGYKWTYRTSKKILDDMGYPKNKTFIRLRCDNCGKYTRPKISRVLW